MLQVLSIPNTDDKGKIVTLTDISDLLANQPPECFPTHCAYSTEYGNTLFPLCTELSNFRMIAGSVKQFYFSRDVFYSLYEKQEQHRKLCKEQDKPFAPQFYACKQDKHWTLLPPTAENLEIYTLIRNSDKSEANQRQFENRCFDFTNNIVCQQVRDENGKLIKGTDGNPITSRCSQCFRAGTNEKNDRTNCCLRHVCKVADCNNCPHPKAGTSPLDIDSYKLPHPLNHVKRAEDREFLSALYKRLDQAEKAYFKEILCHEKEIADYARELSEEEANPRLATIQQRLYRVRDSIRAKAIALKNKYF